MSYRIVETFLMNLIFSSIATSIEIRCYSGLKYVVGQEAIQDTENCDAILGMGDSYCYKFMEETNLNEVIKMGCSSFFCNGIGNRCMDADLLGMKGTLCCCNDRHYCNSSSQLNFPFLVSILLILILSLF